MGIYDAHEYWPAQAVRAYLGLASSDAARTQMTRWGVPEGPRDPGTGVKRWAQQDVLDAAAARPGRGHRTDIQRPNAAYVAAMLLGLDATGAGVVERAELRAAWVRRYPEDRDSQYPADRAGADLDAWTAWQSRGTVAARRVQSALAKLAREGAVSRTDTTVTLLDRDLLSRIAQRVQDVGRTPQWSPAEPTKDDLDAPPF